MGSSFLFLIFPNGLVFVLSFTCLNLKGLIGLDDVVPLRHEFPSIKR